MSKLCACLQKNSSLRTLNLSGNQLITSNSVTYFHECLRNNSTIKRLDLHFTDMLQNDIDLLEQKASQRRKIGENKIVLGPDTNQSTNLTADYVSSNKPSTLEVTLQTSGNSENQAQIEANLRAILTIPDCPITNLHTNIVTPDVIGSLRQNDSVRRIELQEVSETDISSLKELVEVNPMIEEIVCPNITDPNLLQKLNENKADNKNLEQGLETNNDRLIEQNANPRRHRIQTDQGRTLLHWAVENQRVDLIADLLRADASTLIVDSEYGTAEELARKKGMPEVIGLIEERRHFDKLMKTFRALFDIALPKPLKFYVLSQASTKDPQFRIWVDIMTKHLTAAGAVPYRLERGLRTEAMAKMKQECDVLIVLLNQELIQEYSPDKPKESGNLTSDIMRAFYETQIEPNAKRMRLIQIKWKSDVDFIHFDDLILSEDGKDDPTNTCLSDLKEYYKVIIGDQPPKGFVGVLPQLFDLSSAVGPEQQKLYETFRIHFNNTLYFLNHHRMFSEDTDRLKQQVFSKLNPLVIDENFEHDWAIRIGAFEKILRLRGQTGNAFDKPQTFDQEPDNFNCFISYAWEQVGSTELRQLQDQLTRLANWLKLVGFHVFFDIQMMGSYMPDKMRVQLLNSKYVFLIQSARLKARAEEIPHNNLQFELNILYNNRKKKTIIPLLVSDDFNQLLQYFNDYGTRVDFQMKDYLVLDLRTGPLAQHFLRPENPLGIYGQLRQFVHNGISSRDVLFSRLYDAFVTGLVYRLPTDQMVPSKRWAEIQSSSNK